MSNKSVVFHAHPYVNDQGRASKACVALGPVANGQIKRNIHHNEVDYCLKRKKSHLNKMRLKLLKYISISIDLLNYFSFFHEFNDNIL